jgi:hypothetical protein
MQGSEQVGPSLQFAMRLFMFAFLQDPAVAMKGSKCRVSNRPLLVLRLKDE